MNINQEYYLSSSIKWIN